MKTHLRKRLVSLLLSVVFAFYLLPAEAMATGEEPEELSEEGALQWEPEEDYASDAGLDLPDSYPDPFHDTTASFDPVGIVSEIPEGRDEYQKEYRLRSGVNMAVVYPYAVHYRENGAWAEIDNTLRAVQGVEGGLAYHNTAGVWDVSLPAQLNTASSIEIEKDGYTLGFRFAGELTAAQTGEPVSGSGHMGEPLPGGAYQLTALQTSFASLESTPIGAGATAERAALAKTHSAVTYGSVFADTSLRYDLVSSRLKESITIGRYHSGLAGYQYLLDIEDLTPVLQEDNEILLYAVGEEDPVLRMPAPYLYDAADAYCDEIRIELEETEDGCLLTYLLPTDWLTETDRVYPVVLDPIIEPPTNSNNVYDQTVAEYPNTTTSNLQWGKLELGLFPGTAHGGRERVFMKFTNLPALSSADVVVSASVKLYTHTVDTAMPIEVHQVNEFWSHTANITWANMPACSTSVEDYANVSNQTYCTWDITNIAQHWYAAALNTGIMFRSPAAIENGNSQKFVQFYSADWDVDKVPVLHLCYVNNCGLENIWDYTAQAAGRAGTGYINDYTGNLVWVNEGLGFSGTRIPVAIRHIYNANDKDNNRFGLGYGWRTNYNQLVYQWTQDTSYYIWEDEDGTRHYFKYKSSGTYEDESGNGLVLTTTGSGTSKYCITDKQENKSYFDTNGRLRKISNCQATVSNIVIAYTSDSSLHISSITDGAGRVYQYTYSSSAVSKIAFKGTGSSALSAITYTQNASHLTGITYPDGNSVSFTYSTSGNNIHLLTSAVDVGGYKLAYTYTASAPFRVKTAKEYDGSTAGGTLSIVYAHNQTSFTDHNGNREIMQFNHWGSTVSVQDGLGRGQFFNYKSTDDLNEGSQLTLSSKLQNTVINLTRNGSFEKTGYWTKITTDADTGSWGYSTAEAYRGNRSVQITRTADSTAFRLLPTSGSRYTLEPGKTYTVSAYVKTTGMSGTGDGASISIAQIGVGTPLARSDTMKSNGGWTRLEATYTHPATAEAITGGIYLDNRSVGTAYFDCVQFEEGAVASRYNLVENGDFHYAGDTSADAYAWSRGSAFTSTEKRMSYSASPAAPDALDSYVYTITGTTASYKHAYQSIPVSGSAKDVYSVSGWAYGDSVPLTGSRQFAIAVRFFNTDGTETNRIVSFNPDMDSNWQYAAARVVADKDYSSIYVLLYYDLNQNVAYFDGIQLFKERFGHTYSYDTNGNLTSAVDLRAKKTQYAYTNNNLTGVSLPTGATESYTYDSYHNVKTAVDANGVTTTFTYDTYGNNTRVKSVGNGTSSSVSASAAYSSNGNQLASVTDAQGNTITYSYNAQTGALSSFTAPGQSAVSYTYDSLYRTTGATQGSSSASYTYTEDLLTALTAPSGTAYTLAYTSFDLLSSVKIGTRSLAAYTYTSHNHYLNKLTYGNGDYVQYTYDSFGRPVKEVWEDGDTVSCVYGSDGALGRRTDSRSGITTQYG
ncbi:MAG: hypothetical protein E7426_04585, partial [Ruminococcaceae bacterium]|nr:hypothetical protein [Oscillospiraceae bacterium]